MRDGEEAAECGGATLNTTERLGRMGMKRPPRTEVIADLCQGLFIE